MLNDKTIKRNNSFDQVKMIGIIGTNGKTTTARLVCRIFKEQKISVGFINCEEVYIDEKKMDWNITDFHEESLLSYIDHMIELGVKVVIVEISERLLKGSSIYSIKWDTIVHTNADVEQNHEDKKVKDLIDCQKRIFDDLSQKGMAIINTDDRNSIKIVENIGNKIIITYGLSPKATITASSIESIPSIKFNCCVQRGITSFNNTEIDVMEFPVSINLIGGHNVYNALAAVATGLIYDALPEDIKRSFEGFDGIRRRMHIVHNGQYKIIDDMSHDPLSYEVVFEAIQGIDYNHLYLINAIVGNGGIELNRQNAAILCNWVKIMKSVKIITTCSEDVVKKKNFVLEEEKGIFHQILKQNNISYEHEDHLEDALKQAIVRVQKDDLILLLGGRGMDEGANMIRRLLKEEN